MPLWGFGAGVAGSGATGTVASTTTRSVLSSFIGGPVGMLITTGTLLYVAYTYWVQTQHDREAVQEPYYCVLPALDTVESARARAMEEDLVVATPAEDEAGSGVGCGPPSEQPGRYGRCVVCMELSARYTFVACGHCCLCEPCLITYAHEKEAARGQKTKRSSPCSVACPLCRKEGMVIKVYMPS